MTIQEIATLLFLIGAGGLLLMALWMIGQLILYMIQDREWGFIFAVGCVSLVIIGFILMATLPGAER